MALEPLGSLLRVEHMAGVGHFPHEEAPAELARWLTVPRSQIVAQQSAGVP